MTSKAKGYFLGALGAASYGTNPIFAIPLYNCGMDSESVLFFRYLLAIPVIALMMKARGRSFALKKGDIVPALAMGILMALSSYTLFVSYKYMGAGIASTLLFLYPIMVAVIMSVFFKEKAGLVTAISIAVGRVPHFVQGRRRNGQSYGNDVRFPLCAAVCNIFSVRKPLSETKRHAHAEAHVLRYIVRNIYVRAYDIAWKRDKDAGKRHDVDQRGLPCRIAHCTFVLLHHTSHYIDWQHAHSHSRCDRTPYGSFPRRYNIGRTHDNAHSMGIPARHIGCESDCGKR